jgi:hypothetical protein
MSVELVVRTAAALALFGLAVTFGIMSAVDDRAAEREERER